MPIHKVTRRTLLLGAGGALAVAGGGGLWLAIDRLGQRRFRMPVERGDAFAPNVYLAVERGGDVRIWLTRSEMGQGIATALPMIVADELDADWTRVKVEQAVADGRYDYGGLGTVASASVRSQWTELRRAGAAARQMLIAAAARSWGVRAGACTARDGAVLHEASGRRLDYGELADAAAAERLPFRPRLKAPSEFRLIGRSLPRRDAAAKVQGSAVFGIDVRIPDMRFAALARKPVPAAHLVEIDETAARAVPGVLEVLHVERGVAVVATNTWAAFRGRDALRVQWDFGGAAVYSDERIAGALRQRLDTAETGVARDDGGVLEALERGANHSAVYETPYLAHAPMEPMNCVAHVRDERCEVWAPTQVPDDARQVAAHTAGLPLERVTVHTTYLGGGFGRRAASDFVAEAVAVSARVGAPVQVVWTREDDMRFGRYREAAAQRIDVALAQHGLPSAWRHRVVTTTEHAPGAGEVNGLALMGADDLPYEVGRRRIEWNGVQAPLPTQIWRSVGHSYTAFAVESVLDELAAAASQDPIDYRLALLPGDHRLRRCLLRVAEQSDWAAARASGRALGVAAASAFESHIALVAELADAAPEAFRVERVWAAVDCGVAVHPSSVIAQIEGGIVFGLTAALFGRIRLDTGRVVESNFDRYRLLRMNEMPELYVDLLPSGEAPGGVGELSVPPVAPAVANALFVLNGERVRTLPLLG